MNTKSIKPVKILRCLITEEGVDSRSVIGSLYFGAPQADRYWEKLGLATKEKGLKASLVPEARTIAVQAESER